MREILFRGKWLDNGAWLEGNLLFDEVSGVAAIVTYINLSGGIQDLSESNVFQVNPETIGQYTGLTDKNGAKVFEGDIVRYTTIDDFVCHSVVGIGEYQQDGSCGEYSPTPCCGAYVEVKAFKCLYACDYFNPSLNKYDYWRNLLEVAASCEVIGNIFDNPKLLKGDD